MRCWISFAVLVLVTGSFAAGAEIGPTRDAYVAADDPLGEGVTNVVYLDQGWSPSASVWFYFTSQGSQIVPYDWFLALEQPDSTTPFRDNRNMLRLRYLPQKPGTMNPDGLPVGFVLDQGVDRNWLGLTCAACHTAEIRYGTTGYRIDGAPTMGDVRALLSSLAEALQVTHDDSAKFARFAAKVLGPNNNDAARTYLKLQMETSLEARIGYNRRNFPRYDPTHPTPPPTSYARLDALGAIVNEVFNFARKDSVPAGDPSIVRPADAPVSYPFLWDTPGQNLVQWVGVPNGGPLGILSLARNVGEVLGVFGGLEIPARPTVFGYRSTVRVKTLREIEDVLKTLRAPRWPAAFPPIDRGAAALGKEIYKNQCLSCHRLIETENLAVMSDSRTDRKTWDNFFGGVRPSGKLEGAFTNAVNVTDLSRIGPTADPSTMVRNAVAGTIAGAWKEPPPDVLSQIRFRTSTLLNTAIAPQTPTYKARPLDGIWATAPYLHNGSVPNLDELLQPAPLRSKSFSIGVRTFDPAQVGFETNVAGFPKLDVTEPGSSNAGHDGPEYGTGMSSEQRRQLIEYLKTL
jgi:hypothetical protein